MNIKALWEGLPRAARISVTAVGGVAVAGTAVAVTVAATGAQLLATSPRPSASPSAGTDAGAAYCDRFVGHLSSDLGRSRDQVGKALADALKQTLADAVHAGDLTQRRADAVRAGATGSQVCPAQVGQLDKKAARRAPGARAVAVGVAEYAKALGIGAAELRQDLQAGSTVKDVAASKGMDENAFRARLVTVVKTDLDKQVAAGRVTQQQEDMLLQRLQNQSAPLPLWDRTVKPRTRAPSPSPSVT